MTVSAVNPTFKPLHALIACAAMMLSACSNAQDTASTQNTGTRPASAVQNQAGAGKTVLVVGATGSIGRHVVPEAARQGYKVKALVRNPARADWGADVAENVVGDLTRPETLPKAVEGVDAVIFVHGTHFRDTDEGREVDYGGVKNVLNALNGRKAHIAYMTAVGITNHNRGSAAMQETVKYKRRAERLIRASGLSYTIVRPGWFDYNDAGQEKLVLRQGDTKLSGTPADGKIARSQLAEVLVNSIHTPEAWGKTVELDSERGAKTTDFAALFAPMAKDTGIDGVKDRDNLPFANEPAEIKADIEAVKKAFAK